MLFYRRFKYITYTISATLIIITHSVACLISKVYNKIYLDTVIYLTVLYMVLILFRTENISDTQIKKHHMAIIMLAILKLRRYYLMQLLINSD